MQKIQKKNPKMRRLIVMMIESQSINLSDLKYVCLMLLTYHQY